MKTSLKIILVVTVSFSLMMAAGCAKPMKKTGFLSDYSRLEAEKDSLRYVNLKRVSEYSKFIV